MAGAENLSIADNPLLNAIYDIENENDRRPMKDGDVGTTTITYYFDSAGQEILDWSGPAGDRTLGWFKDERAAYRAIFDDFEAVADLTLQETGSREDADIILQAVDLIPGGTAGYASTGKTHVVEVFIQGYDKDGRPLKDELGQDVRVRGIDEGLVKHEFGHNLGLDHAFEAPPLPGVTAGDQSQDAAGTFGFNSYFYTMMAYRVGEFHEVEPDAGGWVRPTNEMALDIAALQAIYGANEGHATGDDTYGILSGDVVSIWDAGGRDKIDFSEAEADAVIDLRAATLAVEEGGLGRPSYVDETTASRFGPKVAAYSIAYGVTIEDGETGAGDDALTGNAAGNVLIGNAGDDTLEGGAGDDLLKGGGGVLESIPMAAIDGRADSTLAIESLAGLTQGFTLDMAVRLDDVSKKQSLFYYDVEQSNAFEFGLYFNPDNPDFQLWAEFFDPSTGGGAAPLRTPNRLEAGDEARLTLVRKSDTGEILVYLDGEPLKPGDGSDVLTFKPGLAALPGGTLAFGEGRNGADPMDGAVGEIAIYPGILSPSDIASRSLLEMTKGGDNFVGHWVPDVTEGAHVTEAGSSDLVAGEDVTYEQSFFSGDADLLRGGTGNDTLEGGARDDTLIGDEGIDTAIFNVSSDAASAEMLGDDLIVTSAEGRDFVSSTVERLQFTDQVLTFEEAKDLDGATAPEGGDDEGDPGPSGDGAETGDPITGGDDGEPLGGTEAPERIAAGGGDDTVTAGAGDDTVDAGDGDDDVSAGDGNDRADGGAGGDTIRGDAGDDYLEGGDGDDLIIGDDARSVPEPVTPALAIVDPGEGLAAEGFDAMPKSFTIDALVRIDPLSGAGVSLISYDSPDVGKLGFSLAYYSASKTILVNTSGLVGRVEGVRYKLNFDVPVPVTEGELHRVTMTLDASGNGRVYWDGTPVTARDGGTILWSDDDTAFTGGLSAGGTLAFARDALRNNVDLAGFATLDGAYGEIAVYAGAKSDQEIAARSAADLVDGADASLVAHWVPDLATNAYKTLKGATALGTKGDVTFQAADGSAATEAVVAGSGIAGDDTLVGGQGDDTLIGNGGEDEARFADAAADVTVTAGDDHLMVASSEGTDMVMDDVETLVFGTDTLTYAEAAELGGDGGGTTGETIFGDETPEELSGTEAGESIFSNGGGDTIDAGGGDDLVFGDDGDDRADGGDGDDVLDMGAGDDTLIGGNGDDLLIGGDGQDEARFAAGTDAVIVTAEEDRLIVVSAEGRDEVIDDVEFLVFGDDTLTYAEAAALADAPASNVISDDDGSNQIAGTSAADSILGNGGDDTIFAGGGNDTIDGGDGIDFAAVLLDIAPPTGFDGPYFIDAKVEDDGSGVMTFVPSGETVSFRNVEVVQTSLYADRMVGGAGDDNLLAAAGNDLVQGGGGADFVRGDDGDDTIEGGAGNDDLLGNAGNDVIDGGEGRDKMDGGAGDDTYRVDNKRDRISDESGTDTAIVDGKFRFNVRDTGLDRVEAAEDGPRMFVVGDDRATELVGGDGNDIIAGGGGGDTLTGGDGADSFAFQVTDAGPGVVIADYDRNDKLLFDDRMFGLGDGGIDLRALDSADLLGLLFEGRVAYRAKSKELLVDLDGPEGPSELTLIATFEGRPPLSADDVFLF